MWSVLENVPCALEKNAAVIWNARWISIKSIWSNVSFKAYISLLIFLSGWYVHWWKWPLKSPSIIMLLSVSLFMTINIFLIYKVFALYIEASMLGASVQFSHSVMSNSLQPHELQHITLPCPSPTPRVYSNSYPLSRWCHPTISSSVVPFFSHVQSFPASKSFQMSQFFTSGGQSIGVSASASVLAMSIQDLFPLGWTGWISLQSKGLSRVFSNTTVQKHHFFGT